MNPLLLCQHCGNKTSHTILEKGYEKDEVEFEDGVKFEIDSYLWFTKCDNCGRYSLFNCMDDNPDESSSLWPNERNIDESVPTEIKIAYHEANKVKQISKIAFIIMIRRCLDILCKHEKAKGRDLYLKIVNLGSRGIIPNKLTDMADLIRLIGNNGSHENEIKINEIEINLLDEFFLAIIEYVYIAPQKISKLKKLLGNK